MNIKQLNILLADDDMDDCIFFRQAVEDLLSPNNLKVVHDGEQLMQYLTNDAIALPHVLFLDINMPRKNGFECLSEIKQSEKLKQLPVIMFSTSFEQEVINQLYQNGAQYFIRKPSEFSQFKKIIQETLALIVQDLSFDKTGKVSQPAKENFVLLVEKYNQL